LLVLLFIKYVSDKYAGQPFAPIQIPEGASFNDMVALKGKADIGDQVNKKNVGPLASANHLSNMPDFNDPSKLSSGKEMVDRLTNLISTFANHLLDCSKKRYILAHYLIRLSDIRQNKIDTTKAFLLP
jgi:type I restriction enzyme M protein